MLTVVLSLLFGLVAFASLAQICLSVGAGFSRGRAILAELRERPAAVRANPAWQPALLAAA